MLIIGEDKDNQSHKVVRLEFGDVLTSRGARTFWLTTKHGLKMITDKVGYPDVGRVLFLGYDHGYFYVCIDAKWVAGALKITAENTLGDVPIIPFDGDAEAYIVSHGNLDPHFANLSQPENWIIYPEDQWRSI